MEQVKLCPYGVEGHAFSYDRDIDRITIPSLKISGTGFLLYRGSGNFFFKADDGRYFIIKEFFNPRYAPWELKEIPKETVLEVLAWAMQGQSSPRWLKVSVVEKEIEEASSKLLTGEIHAIYRDTHEHYNPVRGVVLKLKE